MRTNNVKRKLAAGGVAFGTMVLEFNTPGIGRIAADAGAEFVLFDMEHTGWGFETIKNLVATTRAANTVPMVRVPATEYHFVARALDVGVMGVMVPMMESAEQARYLAACAKYPPVGRRGAGFTIAHDDYTGGDVVEKMRSANEEVMLLPLIESAAGIEHADEIAAVDGIDVLWVGHSDLSIALGIPGQFTHPDFLAAIERVIVACKRHGKTAAATVSNVADGRVRLEQGFRCIVFGSDIGNYSATLRAGIAGLRGT